MGRPWRRGPSSTIATTCFLQARASTSASAPLSTFANEAGKEIDIFFSRRSTPIRAVKRGAGPVCVAHLRVRCDGGGYFGRKSQGFPRRLTPQLSCVPSFQAGSPASSRSPLTRPLRTLLRAWWVPSQTVGLQGEVTTHPETAQDVGQSLTPPRFGGLSLQGPQPSPHLSLGLSPPSRTGAQQAEASPAPCRAQGSRRRWRSQPYCFPVTIPSAVQCLARRALCPLFSPSLMLKKSPVPVVCGSRSSGSVSVPFDSRPWLRTRWLLGQGLRAPSAPPPVAQALGGAPSPASRMRSPRLLRGDLLPESHSAGRPAP